MMYVHRISIKWNVNIFSLQALQPKYLKPTIASEHLVRLFKIYIL